MSTIVRWNPFRELAAMQSAMDRIFDESWRDGRPYWNENNLPIDVHETADNYTIVANIPGANPDDININFHDGVLNIGFEINHQENSEDNRVLVQERVYGKFSRSVRVGQNIKADAVEANYNNGVLTLTLPKAEEAKPRQISVKSLSTLPEGKNS